MKAFFDINIIFFSFYEIFLYFLTAKIIIVKYENGFRFHAFCIQSSRSSYFYKIEDKKS
jgi:hypothetical protein